MALAFALRHLESEGGVRLTNYGEYLAKHPPAHEVQIIENTAWSCQHGVERWRKHCGCNSGGTDFRQEWRHPLREALDWLRDVLAPKFEAQAGALFKDPWAARDAYSDVVLMRHPEKIEEFFGQHAARQLSSADRVTALKRLELQRHAMLMYTSCGWFFDDISGLETVQVIEYAGRALQLACEALGEDLEKQFLPLLERASSNLPEHRNGRVVYEKFVKPAMVRWETIGAHFAVSSLFESYAPKARIFCYTVERQDFRLLEAGRARLAVGLVRMTSETTLESTLLSFGAIHFGDHQVNGGVRQFQGPEAYETLVREMSDTFQRADFSEVVRLLDRGFGESTYSLRSLFRDDQRKITKKLLKASQEESESVYRRLYEQNLPTMRFLNSLGGPLPRSFQTAAEFVINTNLRWAVEEDDPNVSQIRTLMHEAALWKVNLDTAGLGYKLSRTIGRMAERLLGRPGDSASLHTLESAIELANAAPFEVNLWRCQNIYFELAQRVFNDFFTRAEQGSAEARDWMDRFISMGELLRIQVVDLKNKAASASKPMTIAKLVHDLLTQRRIPRATYRFQFNKQFTFRDAEALVPYLEELGIRDAYASPVQTPRPGSLHGYDICDHGRIHPEAGGEKAFDAFAAALRQRSMGLVLDVVPNHMGINHADNGWWMDVLENGPSSIHARCFDISWHPVNPDLENRILIPLLEDQHGRVLENGNIQLMYEDGAFSLRYYEYRLPVGPRSYTLIMEHVLEHLTGAMGPDHEHVLELESILTAISYLPPRTELPPRKAVERNREKEIIKRRISSLLSASPEARQAMADTIQRFNGTLGDPRSFDLLERLLENQAYRLAYWRVATEEINYRRFFDINELAAIRVELPEVFQATHGLIFKLLGEGKATGLRIDHPDGLWNPTEYFRKLQETYVVEQIERRLPAQIARPDLRNEVAALLAAEADSSQGEIVKFSPAWLRRPAFLRENLHLGRRLCACGRCCLCADAA